MAQIFDFGLAKVTFGVIQRDAGLLQCGTDLGQDFVMLGKFLLLLYYYIFHWDTPKATGLRQGGLRGRRK